MLTLLFAGLLMGACWVGMALLGNLQAQTIPFLILYGLACVGYGVAVLALHRRIRPKALPIIVGLAALYRLALLLTTPPTLSSDVYRYIWDGRLANSGVNPYAQAVDSPLLDRYDSPQRELVNNEWMASPYLPAAQALFAVVYRLAPDSPLAFQVSAVLCDLLTGWMVIDLLRRLGLPRERSLVYLWHPLVILEFAHGGHVDAWMIGLTVAALWALVASRSRLLSTLALAAATLTKGLPALLLPVVARRWRWPYVLVYLALIVFAILPFALDAGWGLSIPPNGEGLFGALLVYSAYWNYNSGLYHWLEVLLSGYPTPGPVPQEVVGWLPVYLAKVVMALGMGGVMVLVWRKSREVESPLALLRLAIVPLAAYLVLATTVHPWYVTWIVPLLVFLLPRLGTSDTASRFLWPLLYLSLVVPLSYLTYLDPAQPREVALVRIVEYGPFLLLLAWAGYHWLLAEQRREPS
jgi:hypothetical protein